VREKRPVGADRDGQIDAAVLGDAIRDQRRVKRFLSGVHPDVQPAEVARRERVVVFGPERARIVERAVPHHRDQRQPQRRGHRDRLERVTPPDPAAAAQRPRAHGRRVLGDLELAVLALGDDVLGVLLAVGDLLRHVLHERVVRADRVRRQHVDVHELGGHRHRLAAADQRLLLDLGGPRHRGVCVHYSPPPSPPDPARSFATCS
jgi:hypothetical protein